MVQKKFMDIKLNMELLRLYPASKWYLKTLRKKNIESSNQCLINKNQVSISKKGI